MFVRIERSTIDPAGPVNLVELVSPRTNSAGYTPVEHLFAALSREGGASLEIGGNATARRFYARVAGPRACGMLNAQLGAAYPQVRTRPCVSRSRLASTWRAGRRRHARLTRAGDIFHYGSSATAKLLLIALHRRTPCWAC